MKILILTNGSYGDYHFLQEIEAYDKMICVDGAMQHARKLGLKPDLIVGDFDSGRQEDLGYFENNKVRIERFNSHKDQTDTEIAIKYAEALGATQIIIAGGLGSRFDHSLANVYLIYALLKKGIKAKLINEHNSVQLVEKSCPLIGEKGQLVSLLPFTEKVEGVTTKNLAYPLKEATLTRDCALGVSNYLLQGQAEITLQKGILMVIKAKD